MSSQFVVTQNKAFTKKLTTAAVKLQPLLATVVDKAMMDIEAIAKSEYDWNPEGTLVTYPNSGWQYEVTGAAIKSITAFAVGTKRNPYETFSITDPKSGDVHSSEPGLNPAPPEMVGVIQGIVTMSEAHSGYLQQWEARGPSATSPRLTGGGEAGILTIRVLDQHQTELWAAVEKESIVILNTLF